ncbi:prostaglandin D2 receptor 2 [Genypterus blacodes]|uniref:prostaglandin D2 receptor 2 n=1 Tax=Genypterus blacodes TaxID=154954 RepID=UPI003F772991
MSNITSSSDASGEQLFCPVLQAMREHTHDNNSRTNLAVICFHGMVSCLGILENALILWVVGFRLQRRTVASVWVLNLAMSDFLATLTLPLFTFYLYSSHSWELGAPLCSAQASIFFLNMFVSSFLLAAISLDRCLLVSKPVWCQNHRSVAGAWKVCVLGWLWGVINAIPYFLFRSVTETLHKRKLCYHNFALYSSVVMVDRHCKVRQAATAISKLLLAFLIPLVVIAGSYITIGLSLKNRMRKRRESSSRLTGALLVANTEGETDTKKISMTTKPTNIFLKPLATSTTCHSPTPISPNCSSIPASQNLLSQSFTKMVTFVIAAFALCWSPYHTFCIMEVAAQYWPQIVYTVEKGLPLATTLAFLNPVLNPILYAFSCPHFCVRIRQSLGALFDGLVEEGGGILMAPGRSMRAWSRRGSSRDGSAVPPGSPDCTSRPLADLRVPFTNSSLPA